MKNSHPGSAWDVLEVLEDFESLYNVGLCSVFQQMWPGLDSQG